MRYTQLTLKKRYQVSALKKAEKGVRHHFQAPFSGNFSYFLLNLMTVLLKNLSTILYLFCYNFAMTLQERKDTADIIAKEADIVYKKIFILMAVSGAIGGFGLSIFDKASVIGLALLLPFLFLSFGIVLAYLKLNKLEILIKDLRNE